MNTKLVAINTDIDAKISVFAEDVEERLTAKINDVKKSAESRIGHMEDVIGNFKMFIQEQINDFTGTPLNLINELQEKTNKLQNEINGMDCSGLLNSFSAERA